MYSNLQMYWYRHVWSSGYPGLPWRMDDKICVQQECALGKLVFFFLLLQRWLPQINESFHCQERGHPYYLDVMSTECCVFFSFSCVSGAPAKWELVESWPQVQQLVFRIQDKTRAAMVPHKADGMSAVRLNLTVHALLHRIASQFQNAGPNLKQNCGKRTQIKQASQRTAWTCPKYSLLCRFLWCKSEMNKCQISRGNLYSRL